MSITRREALLEVAGWLAGFLMTMAALGLVVFGGYGLWALIRALGWAS